MSKHRRNLASGVILPHKVNVRMPTSQQQLAFTLEVNEYRVNDTSGDPSMLWAVPHRPDYPLVDLADPRLASPHVQYERAASTIAPVSMTRVSSREKQWGESRQY